MLIFSTDATTHYNIEHSFPINKVNLNFKLALFILNFKINILFIYKVVDKLKSVFLNRFNEQVEVYNATRSWGLKSNVEFYFLEN